MFAETKPGVESADSVKFLYNVGALLDIPTGAYLKGVHGESILNGGLGILTGITGKGSSYKSTIMHYMMLSAAARVGASGEDSYLLTYDTEMNVHIARLKSLALSIPEFEGRDILDEGVWVATDKVKHMGNKWYEILKTFLDKEKIKNAKKYIRNTPFVDKDNNLLPTIFPTFSEIDSLTEFETDDVSKIQSDNELGDSGGNMLHMRSSLAKTRLMMELPRICNAANHYTLISAHMGAENNIQQGPISTPPPRKLQYLKSGEKIKGITDKFYFLTNNFWQVVNSSVKLNQGTKGSEYPKVQGDDEVDSTDLNIVSLKLLRSKTGPGGITVDILVSQEDGVLPSLSEFHNIKENGRFGLSGSLQFYSLDIYPDVKLSRTTVRGKIDNDPLLRRALNITSELCQMNVLRKFTHIKKPTPAELYTKLKADGYDWNELLSTRGWWTFNNDTRPVNFLSTMDLIRMYHGIYKPYWRE